MSPQRTCLSSPEASQNAAHRNLLAPLATPHLEEVASPVLLGGHTGPFGVSGLFTLQGPGVLATGDCPGDFLSRTAWCHLRLGAMDTALVTSTTC